MSINIYEILVTMLNTVITYFIMRHFFFKPVSEFMAKRSKMIADNIENAEIKLADASKVKLDYEQKLLSSKEEGKKIVEEHKLRANKLYETLKDEANQEAESIIQRAKTDAKLESDKAREGIKNEVVSLSLLAASKAIGEELDEKKHHKLIEEFINKVGV